MQEAFDQLARIYASVGFLKRQASAVGSTAIDSNLGLQGSPIAPQLSNPWAAPASRVDDSRFTPLSYGSPSIRAPLSQLVGDGGPLDSLTNSWVPRNTFLSDPDSRPSPLAAAPPATASLPNAKDGEVLSDVASDDGLREGQQYAHYRPPVAMRGVRVGVDEEGRDVLIPDKPTDRDQAYPFEKLKQRGYPSLTDDSASGSAMVKDIREREQYGKHHAGYHRYEFTDYLCDLGDPVVSPTRSTKPCYAMPFPAALLRACLSNMGRSLRCRSWAYPAAASAL